MKAHLLQVEESYTQELLQAEQREQILREQLNQLRAEHVQLQQRLSNDRSLITLRAEADQARQGRDVALERITHLEDELARSQAAQSNLQAVMEQLIQGRF